MKHFLVILSLFVAINGFSQPSACRLLRNVPSSLKTIKDSSRKMSNDLSDNGKCIIDLIDSLKSRFIKTHKTEYLVCLDSICWNCNEYVGENFVDTVLFYQSFKPYIDYLYQNGDTGNCLAINLISGFGFDLMDDPNDKYDAKKRLEGFIAEQEHIYKFSDDEKAFIELIKREAEMFDLDDKE